MSLRKDLSDEEFDRLSLTKKKKYVAELLIKDSGAKSVREPRPPMAIVMAGLPGAGKTEFLDTFSDLLKESSLDSFVRIDLDEIVTIYPGYTPKTDAKFRSQGSSTVARCVDIIKDGRYNMMIDGTFAGTTGASIKNIKRLLEAGYIVYMFLMHDNVETSWSYTKDRELLTARGITLSGFKNACKNVPHNVEAAIEKFGDKDSFFFALVKQKTLRSKEYNVISDRKVIDELLKKGYNIDKLKDI